MGDSTKLLKNLDGLQPFAKGDVFVGATELNSADDDHAGRGRILQYDADLNLKGVLWVKGTTHLVYGLNFAPDGVLWAHDPWAWITVRVAPDGQQLQNRQFAERAFSMAHFPADGSVLLTESIDGENQPEPLTTRHKTLPGEKTRLGDGDIYRFDQDGNLLEVFDPDTHGGMSGSMAVTHSILSADGNRLIYVSETGPRLMQYDLSAGKQLADILVLPDQPGQMLFDLTPMSDARLLICMGNRVELLTESGEQQRVYTLEGFGWSIVAVNSEQSFAYVGNWFTGEVAKLELENNQVVGSTMVAEKCMAGIAVFPDA